jgi:hypothetical protein
MTINPIRAVRDRCTAARRAERLELVAFLRRRADECRGNPSDAARRSVLGQAANEVDRGLGGEYDRAIDAAYRAGRAAGRAERPVSTGHVAVAATLSAYGGAR